MFVEILASIGAVTVIIAVFSKKEKVSKIEKINATYIANHFRKSAAEINQIFLDLKWIEKNDKWYIATELGLKNGANQRYNNRAKNKYVEWEKEVINNQELIEKIDSLKTQNIKILNAEKKENSIVKNKKMTNEEKKEKGDRYERYVANFFREQGYYVWEHGKEKGVLDSGMDLFIKKNEFIYFVQCKDWEIWHREDWKIDHDTVQAIQTKVRNLLKREEGLRELTKKYEQKILYVTSKQCLTAGAYKYIEENSDILEHQVIPINE